MKPSDFSTVIDPIVLHQGVQISKRRGELRSSIITSLQFEWCKGKSSS